MSWAVPVDDDGGILYDTNPDPNDVEREAYRLRVGEAARAKVKAEREADAPPFDLGTLGEMLQRPPEPPARIEGLIPWEAGTLVVAQKKTGKTTLTLNLARSLLSGEDFLGRFPVRPLTEGTIAVLNYEVSGRTWDRWADEHGLPHDRVVPVHLRGRRNPFAHPEDMKRLAYKLGNDYCVEAVVVDTFGKAFVGKSQNDPGEVTAWLSQLDQWARTEAGARDIILTAHAGWNGERTRGASSLDDWADSIITMTRDPEDETQRFLRAEGRDVLVDEDRLHFHPDTRTLSLTGTGSRKAARQNRHSAELAVYVVRACTPQPVTGRAVLERAIKDMDDAPTFRNGEVSKAAEYAAKQGLLSIEDQGPGRPKVYRALDPSQPVPDPSRGRPANPSHPSYIGDGWRVGSGEGVHPSQPGRVDNRTSSCPECSEPLPAGKARHPECFLRSIRGEAS